MCSPGLSSPCEYAISQRMRSKRQCEIIELAKGLVFEKGFYAMSYQALSDILCITKATIHGHFRTKEKLGVAILENSIAEMRSFWEKDRDDPKKQIEVLLDHYEEMAQTHKNMCLVSILQSEYDLLPESMKNLLNTYNRSYIEYAADALQRARNAGLLSFAGPAYDTAVFVLSAIQGAMLNARSVGPEAARTVKRQLLIYLSE